MSNYNSLKATIDANIKQNGNQEITGQILNSVLNQMVTTLGAGYQFAGVATIATDPGTPDAKVFYIANGKGTYTNFGGINVTEDEVVVLYYDTEWHKVSTGIASQAKLSELEEKVSNISSDGSEPLVDYDATSEAEAVVSSRYNESLQLVATTSAYTAYKLDVSEYGGGTVSFLSYGIEGYSNGFIMQDGTLYGVLPANTSGYNKPTTYDIPKNAKYLCITHASKLTQKILINLDAGEKGRLEIVEEEIVSINERLSNTPSREEIVNKADLVEYTSGKNLFNKNDIIRGFYIASSDGYLIDRTSAAEKFAISNLIPIEEGKTYFIHRDTALGYNGIRFVAADGETPLKALDPSGAAKDWTLQSGVIVAPIGARYFQFQVVFNSTTVSCADDAQFEEGYEFTGYEPYETKKVLREDQLPKSVVELLGRENKEEYKKNKLYFTTQNGGVSRIVSNYNEEEELVLTCEFYPIRQNKVFNYTRLYKKNKSTGAETELKSCTDDICPVLMGGGSSYIGGAHGASGFMKISATHDKTVIDIGSVWSSGGVNYVIAGVDSDKVWLISENQSEYPRFSFAIPSANATFSHVRGATHTSDFTIETLPSSFKRQWWPMCSNSIHIYADGVEITQDGDYEFNVLKVVEHYDIPNPASCVELLKQKVGTFTENVTPVMLYDADKLLRISNVYTINGADEQFVATTLTFMQDGNFDFFGFTQSIGVSGEHYWQYIPKAKSLDGNSVYDFRTIIDMKGNSGGKIRPIDYENAQLPPDRFLQFDENIGQFMSYLFDYGVGGVNRAENNYAAFHFSSNGEAKQYPMGWSRTSGGVSAYESKSAVCWRKFIDPATINKNGVISVNLFEYDDKLYIYADYNAAGLYEIEIPQKYVGKKIEVFEQRNNVHLLNDVSNNKIQIKVDTDDVMYGYLVAQIK